MVDGGGQLTVESWPIEKVLPYAENARAHPKAQVSQLVKSIRQFGFANPLLVDADGVLIAGHGRLLAAAKLKLAEVPVIRLGHLSAAQARALRLADNRIALNSGWDETVLAAELAAVAAEFDLGSLGFGADELEALLPPLEEASIGGAREGEDEVPREHLVQVSQPGDVWLCGPHRVMCGQPDEKAAVEALLGPERPHLLVTDASIRPLRGVWQVFPGSVAYVFHEPMLTREILQDLEAAEFEHRSMVIWVRDQADGLGEPYDCQHLQGWYVVRKGETGHWNGARDQSTVWRVPGPSIRMPVEVMRRPIVNNSEPGQGVYDPILAEGATLIACETEGRRCFGMESDPVLVDVAVLRWQAFTGLEATLASDGRSFAAVAVDRQALAEAA
jgi:hypothetical protein